jgi:hypothetical protein
MSDPKPDFSEFPRTIKASTERGEDQYRVVEGYFAVHGQPAAPGAALHFSPEKIAIYPTDRLAHVDAPRSQLTPAYSLGKGGALAVPTGKVFVRLAADQKFAERAKSFRDAGYEIDQTLSYAPNAGWLRPRSSSIGASLSAIKDLAAMPGVENVEPQMLTKAARKS